MKECSLLWVFLALALAVILMRWHHRPAEMRDHSAAVESPIYGGGR